MEFRENNPEFFIQEGKKNLVITIGDSWTWGDSLGNIPATKQDDLQARQTQCYGRHIANELNADWLNCGYCGYGNIRIIQKLYELVTGDYSELITKQQYNSVKGISWPEFESKPYSKKLKSEIAFLLHKGKSGYRNHTTLLKKINQYDKIYYVVTLTETGRQVDCYDFSSIDQANEPEELLIAQEQIIYNLLTRLSSKYDINLTVARNFTVDYEATKTVTNVSLNWVQINYNHNQLSNNNSNTAYEDISCTGPITYIAIGSMPSKKSNYKKYLISQNEYSNSLVHWLRNNPLHHNIASCHPTKESHKLWAEYLLTHINK